MKKWLCLCIIPIVFAAIGCNKPADDVKGAKERVQKKVDEEHNNQTAENPGE
jgi:hypothetical protein